MNMTTQEQINQHWRNWFDGIKAQDIAKAVRSKRAIDVLSRQQNARRATVRALSQILPCLAGMR